MRPQGFPRKGRWSRPTVPDFTRSEHQTYAAYAELGIAATHLNRSEHIGSVLPATSLRSCVEMGFPVWACPC